MTNVFCFAHPSYDGTSSPELSCKACCTKYIAVVTAAQAKSRQDRAQKAYGLHTRKKKLAINSEGRDI